MKTQSFMVLLYIISSSKIYCQNAISADQAINHIGESKTVEGYEYYSEFRKDKNISN